MGERHDAYRGIARHYDLHRMDWYARVYGKRLTTLLAERGLAGGRVLDAGCGTGSLALLLTGEGYRVTGVDLSEALLERAREKDTASAVRWMSGDITKLDLGEAFDAVTCVADVLNHLETLDEWERAFRCFANHLVPGGVLFFDSMTCYGLERLDAYQTQDRADGVLILGVIWEGATRRSTLKMTSFIPSGSSGLWDRATETITEWGQPVEGIYERLRRAGFETTERVFGEGSDPEAEERLAVVVKVP